MHQIIMNDGHDHLTYMYNVSLNILVFLFIVLEENLTMQNYFPWLKCSIFNLRNKILNISVLGSFLRQWSDNISARTLTDVSNDFCHLEYENLQKKVRTHKSNLYIFS